MKTDNRIKSPVEPIMASPVVVRSRSFASRIVLYRRKGDYVVHLENLISKTPEGEDTCAFEHYNFQHGSYFMFNRVAFASHPDDEKDAYQRAEKCFNERLNLHMSGG